MESSITCLINDERTSYGLQPVTPNTDLRQAALSHSNEMINQSYFEHTSPAGLTFMDRIESTGYMRGARSLDRRREPGLGHRAAEHTAGAGDRLDEQPAPS